MLNSSNYKSLPTLILIALLILGSACSSLRHFNAMTPQERAEYLTIAEKMTLDQRKAYLRKDNNEERMEYLKELGLHEIFMNQVAFTRLDEEMRQDFLKAYMNASPDQINQLIAKYDEDTQDRIRERELQFGWNSKQVILALGNPTDILEQRDKQGSNQLWIYNDSSAVSYLYFENDQLKNWTR